MNSGDYADSTDRLEEALRLYLHEHELCQAECEGFSHFPSTNDLYAAIAGLDFLATPEIHQTDAAFLIDPFILLHFYRCLC